MFKALKNSFNSLGEMLDKHYAKQIEKDLKKGKVVDHRRPFGQVLDEDILVNRGRTYFRKPYEALISNRVT